MSECATFEIPVAMELAIDKALQSLVIVFNSVI